MNDPHDSEIEEANVRLTEGLKSCRSVVESYRAMIAGDEINPDSGDTEATE